MVRLNISRSHYVGNCGRGKRSSSEQWHLAKVINTKRHKSQQMLLFIASFVREVVDCRIFHPVASTLKLSEYMLGLPPDALPNCLFQRIALNI